MGTQWMPALATTLGVAVVKAAPACAAVEESAALVARLRSEKPRVAVRWTEFLAERYDVSGRPLEGVTMSRGGPVQGGVYERLPREMTWEQLVAMAREELKRRNLWPACFLPLPHPHHEAGGMVFPPPLIDETRRETGRDLTRFDLAPSQHFLPGFPAPRYFTMRPDLGDVPPGKLVTPFPQAQFAATGDRRSFDPHLGVACFDCRHRISLTGAGSSRLHAPAEHLGRGARALPSLYTGPAPLPDLPPVPRGIEARCHREPSGRTRFGGAS